MSAERVFLHDISSPLTNLNLNLETMDAMVAAGDFNKDEYQKLLGLCLRHAQQMMEMIHARRAIVKSDNTTLT